MDYVTFKCGDHSDKLRLREGGKVVMQSVQTAFGFSVIRTLDGIIMDVGTDGLSLDTFQPGDVVEITGTRKFCRGTGMQADFSTNDPACVPSFCSVFL